MMGLRLSKLRSKLSLFTLILALALWLQPYGSAQAAQDWVGPQLVEDYIGWDPGGGRDSAGCFDGTGTVNFNELTGFEGAFVTLNCSEVLAGEFISFLSFEEAPPAPVFASPEDYIAFLESSGNRTRLEVVVDEESRHAKTISISAYRALVRNPDGSVRIFKEREFNPNNPTDNEFVAYVVPMHPESVGDHNIRIRQIIEDFGLAFELGTRFFSVNPN